ncbi:MAG: CRISPR-associated DxTHG motif protein, partial [Candidatus Binataceae bacterium]
MNRTLVTVLGNTPKPARYAFDGAEPVDARLAPAALIKLLPQTLRPSEIVALCTPEARKTSWPLLEQDLAGCEIKVTCADVAAQEQNNFAAFSRKVADRIPRDPAPTDLMVDVTHGPRHLAMFTLLAVQYVSALRRIELAGVYYGRLETSTEPSQIVDLRPLLDLSEWLYALRVFDEAADARPLGELLKRDRSQPHEPQRMSDELR